MRVVIDIPDETFLTGDARVRAARYVRNVAVVIEATTDNNGVVPLILGSPDPIHSAGWACEGSPWQKSSLDIEEKV